MKKTPLLQLVGQKIAKLRKKKGFSQEEFAEECGFHRTYIGTIERGEQSITIKNLMRMALILNVEIRILVPKLSEIKKLSKNLR
jgi:transcriptional regulator with XRE-family HTH domain